MHIVRVGTGKNKSRDNKKIGSKNKSPEDEARNPSNQELICEESNKPKALINTMTQVKNKPILIMILINGFKKWSYPKGYN